LLLKKNQWSRSPAELLTCWACSGEQRIPLEFPTIRHRIVNVQVFILRLKPEPLGTPSPVPGRRHSPGLTRQDLGHGQIPDSGFPKPGSMNSTGRSRNWPETMEKPEFCRNPGNPQFWGGGPFWGGLFWGGSKNREHFKGP